MEALKHELHIIVGKKGTPKLKWEEDELRVFQWRGPKRSFNKNLISAKSILFETVMWHGLPICEKTIIFSVKFTSNGSKCLLAKRHRCPAIYLRKPFLTLTYLLFKVSLCPNWRELWKLLGSFDRQMQIYVWPFSGLVKLYFRTWPRFCCCCLA